MSTKIDKALILSEIKSMYNFQKDAEFARFLDIKPQTLSSWYSRNTFDIELLYSKCVGLSAEWLLTGKGEMLKGGSHRVEEPNPNYGKSTRKTNYKEKYYQLLEENRDLRIKIEDLQEQQAIKSQDKQQIA